MTMLACDHAAMMAARLWCVKFLAFLLLALASVVAFNVVVDPFQLFRPSGAFIVDREHQRLANAGLIRTAPDFVNVAVGSSFIGNLRTGLVTELFGGRTLLLSMAAGGNRDMLLTAAYVLKRRPSIRNAFIEVARDPCTRDVQHLVYFPMGVYRDRWLGVVDELMSMETTRLAVLKLRMRYAGHYFYPFSDRIENMHGWYAFMRDRFGNPDHVRRQFKDPGSPAVAPTPAGIEARASGWARCYVDEYLAFASAYPAVQFYFFLPPAFQWQQWLFRREGFLQVLARGQEIASGAVSQQPNAQFFDFDAAHAVTNDCRRYMDMFHFDPAAVDDMVRWMREGRYQVTAANSRDMSRTILENARERVPCSPLQE
jgi:hypothetical protein